MNERSKLASLWQEAGEMLGFEVVAPFSIVCPDGTQINADALVKGFGATHGMLLLTEYDQIKSKSSALQVLGYGYSVFLEPRESRPSELDSFVSVLSDWGWAGEESTRPSWLKATTDE